MAQTARLFVRNLPYAATAPELTAVFQEHGELSEVHIIQDRCSLRDFLTLLLFCQLPLSAWVRLPPCLQQ